MSYTIKKIAEETGTYKKRVERWLKANSIECEYVDGDRKTKYYSDQTMLDFIEYMEKSRKTGHHDNHDSDTDTKNTKKLIELKTEKEVLQARLEDEKAHCTDLQLLINNQKGQIETLQGNVKMLQTMLDSAIEQKSDLIEELKAEVQTLKALLNQTQEEKKEQNQTISELLELNKKNLDTIEQTQNQIREIQGMYLKATKEAHTATKEQNTSTNESKPEKPVKTAKKGILERIFKKYV